MTIKLGMIGGGVMGEALLSRLIAQGIYANGDILVSEPQESRRLFLQDRYGVRTIEPGKRFPKCEVLLLAIKPQIFATVVKDLEWGDERSGRCELVISILAGVRLSQLESAFPGLPVLRVMPNTPATVGAGISAIASGQWVKEEHLQSGRRIFTAVGKVIEIPESQMDGVTGLSGSGPGYVAILIEALTDGGVYAGLPRPVAAELALQTVLGTAMLLEETGIHPAELKDRVTSPGGTTIAGIAQLERSGFRSALIDAVKAAYLRSQDLGN